MYDDIHDVDQARSLLANATKLTQLAASGEFTVNPEGGSSLIDALDEFLHWLSDNSDKILFLQQRRKLGGSNGAVVLAGLLPEVAQDSHGFITQLTALRASLEITKEGIQAAMGNYRRTEEETSTGLTKINPGSSSE
ncbi:hypothetical protein ACFQ1S_15545 [Kibdelosporangium lantanae]|uniref:Uncharacterized protein n=1 Tax=Kibdelosporangium lantanae TaxID=1497396 RepID=A0ABW3M806_9PSEU